MRTSKDRYKKISNMPGFRILVDYARNKLGLMATSLEEVLEANGYRNLVRAVWTIMDLYELQSEDQLFVMTSIMLGTDEALKAKPTSAVTIFVPEMPIDMANELAVEVAEILSRKPDLGRWLSVTEDGQPSGVEVMWRDVPYRGPRPRAKVVRGPGVASLMIRNGQRIYMDVTRATKEDILRALPEVAKLRKQFGVRAPQLKRGAPFVKDESRAVEAALLRRKGKTYEEISKKFKWSVKYEEGRPSSSTAEKYIRLGEEILEKVKLLNSALEFSCC